MDSRLEVLRQVAADADLISVSRTTTSGSTPRGLGATSGRAIMAVGDLALRGMESMNIWYRLRTIGNQLRQSARISSQAVQDLLELQRIGLYTNNVRRKAWSLILILLESQQTEQLLDVLLPWRSVESQLFLRQLAAHKLSGWTAVTEDTKSIPEDALDTRGIRITDSFCNIASTLLDRDPSLLHEIFDIYDFSALLQPNYVARSWDEYSNTALPQFFNSLLPWYTSSSTHPRLATCMINFLTTGPPDHVHLMVGYLNNALHPFSCSRPDPAQTARVFSDHPELAQCNFSHPTYPFLLLAKGLAEATELARMSFGTQNNRKLIGIIADLCAYDFPEPGRNRRMLVSRRCRFRRECCMLLAALYWTAPDLVERLRDANVDGFYDIFPHMMDLCSRNFDSESGKKIQIAFYDTLLGLTNQRILSVELALYVPNRAWDIILLEMLARHEGQLALSILERSHEEMLLFLQQLSWMNLSRWSDCQTGEAKNWSDYGDQDILDSSFHSLLLAVVEQNPLILSETYDIEENADCIKYFWHGLQDTMIILAPVIAPFSSINGNIHLLKREARRLQACQDVHDRLTYKDANAFAESFVKWFATILSTHAPVASALLKVDDMKLMARQAYMIGIAGRDAAIARDIRDHLAHFHRMHRASLSWGNDFHASMNFVDEFTDTFLAAMSRSAPVVMSFVSPEDLEMIARAAYHGTKPKSDDMLVQEVMDLIFSPQYLSLDNNEVIGSRDMQEFNEGLDKEYAYSVTTLAPFAVMYLKYKEVAYLTHKAIKVMMPLPPSPNVAECA